MATLFDRRYGYGGYKYDGRWIPVVKDFIDYFKLNENSSILDIGAGKGFMVKDFKDALPNARVLGIDISKYFANVPFEILVDLLNIFLCTCFFFLCKGHV